MNTSKTITTSVNILVHVIILFSFLSVFFFMYISKIESDAFKSELGSLVSNEITNMLDKNPAIVFELSEIKPVITKFTKMYEKPMRSSLERNIMVKLLAAFTIIILVGILLTMVLTVTYECKEKVDMSHILIENIIIFTFIGVVEFLFFTRVAIKYVPVLPSTMINTMIEATKESISKSM